MREEAARPLIGFWINTHDAEPTPARTLASHWFSRESLVWLCVAASSPHAADRGMTALPTLRNWTGVTGRTTEGTHPRVAATDNLTHGGSRHTALDVHNRYLNAKLLAILAHMRTASPPGSVTT